MEKLKKFENYQKKPVYYTDDEGQPIAFYDTEKGKIAKKMSERIFEDFLSYLSQFGIDQAQGVIEHLQRIADSGYDYHKQPNDNFKFDNER